MTPDEFKDFKAQFRIIPYSDNDFFRKVVLDFLNKIVKFGKENDVDRLELQGSAGKDLLNV